MAAKAILLDDSFEGARVDAVANKDAPIGLFVVARTRAPRLQSMAESLIEALCSAIEGKHRTPVQLRATVYSDMSDSCNLFVTEVGATAWAGNSDDATQLFQATLGAHQQCVERLVNSVQLCDTPRRVYTHDVCFADGTAMHWEGT